MLGPFGPSGVRRISKTGADSASRSDLSIVCCRLFAPAWACRLSLTAYRPSVGKAPIAGAFPWFLLSARIRFSERFRYAPDSRGSISAPVRRVAPHICHTQDATQFLPAHRSDDVFRNVVPAYAIQRRSSSGPLNESCANSLHPVGWVCLGGTGCRADPVHTRYPPRPESDP